MGASLQILSSRMILVTRLFFSMTEKKRKTQEMTGERNVRAQTPLHQVHGVKWYIENYITSRDLMMTG